MPLPHPDEFPLARPLTDLERLGQITWNHLGLRDPKDVEAWFRKLRQDSSGNTDGSSDRDVADDWKR